MTLGEKLEALEAAERAVLTANRPARFDVGQPEERTPRAIVSLTDMPATCWSARA